MRLLFSWPLRSWTPYMNSCIVRALIVITTHIIFLPETAQIHSHTLCALISQQNSTTGRSLHPLPRVLLVSQCPTSSVALRCISLKVTHIFTFTAEKPPGCESLRLLLKIRLVKWVKTSVFWRIISATESAEDRREEANRVVTYCIYMHSSNMIKPEKGNTEIIVVQTS